MKNILPFALVLALFACNTHTANKPSPVTKYVLTDDSMYDLTSIRVAMVAGDEQAARKLLALGNDTYINKKDIPASIDLFKKAIRTEPTAKAYFQLGSALTDAGFYDEAEKALHIAEQLDYSPKANVMFRLAQAYSNQALPSEDLRDSLALHYMEVAIQMGYPHSEDFLKNGTFSALRNAKNFQSIYDEVVAANTGNTSPGRLFWERFRSEFSQLKLPLTINTMWMQSHKLENIISFDYVRFVPETAETEFARDATDVYYYCGLLKNDTAYTALLYAGRDQEVEDANHYTPESFTLVTFDNNGMLIDKMRAGGQKNFTDTFKVFTMQPNFTFQIRDYRNIYKNDPDQVGYEHNYVVRSEPLGTNTYRIAANGKFERIDAPLAMR